MPRGNQSTDHVFKGRPGWPAPKLTGAQRDEITRRLADNEDPQDLATEYGVTASTIRRYR